MFKSIFVRFIKGAVAGAIASMGMVVIQTPSAWSDLNLLLGNLGLAAAFGAITGLLLALQKWATWQD